MNRRPPCSTRTDTLFPYTTLFRSGRTSAGNAGDQVLDLDMPEVDRQADITDRFENDASGEGRRLFGIQVGVANLRQAQRSAEHTSDLQSLMRISYAVFCLNKKTQVYAMTTSKKRIPVNVIK